MSNYTILAVVNLIWFLFVILILKASHDLRMKLQNELDGMADELRKDCVKMKSQLEAVERARDKYVTDVINNKSTIADLKKELETYETTYNDMNRIIGERDAAIHELEQTVGRLKNEAVRYAEMAKGRDQAVAEQRNQAEKFRFEREQLKAELHEFRKYHTSLRTAVSNAVSSLGTALEET